jgi:hypothetical protein
VATVLSASSRHNTMQRACLVLKINQIRMRNLESMIAEFVDGLLQTIREATIEDLRELLLAEAEKARPSETPRPEQAIRTAAGGRAGRATGAARRVNGALVDPHGSPPSVAEITDPESLLSLGRATNGAREAGVPTPGQKYWLGAEAVSHDKERPRPARPAPKELPTSDVLPAPESTPELEADGPASNVWPVGSGAPVRLSDNETLARVSNAGIVIRRRKKA